ncbi:3-hydroxyisobutyrate dehydrogenase and related beta-hydroxyacid dehydrogenase [Hahella chejuensis KCTC 2396]|uniref:3-hydroxyisobutyrate dehydrogenase and related beta-hydroxyacid dehydrogenase n=1 Tax=Hahella chejuensis (strain KCTC 2396) TaxID=349521 RepID=Q2SD26_HAHCH|nr:NAD(P)-dependent oxidoreductase [Hahella chejuensis]ABC31448.1 3-hydroxyisobutyrate dehydrogenase and related beta-hydroxyacid dehydrogenase [Hahella chejuensis KCTC 2396]
MESTETAALGRICFIGLGVMGFPMAGHLANNGHQVTVYNRNVEKSERWLKTHTGKFIRKLRDAAQCDVIISCVGDDNDLRSIYLGEEGLINQLRKGSLIIDHTTASASVAKELFETAQERNIGFLDAPVSGGQQGAENGALTIMCGGEEKDFARAQALFKHYSRAATLMGHAGSGQLTKMANQIAIAGLVQGLAEALHFAEQADLDPLQVVNVISKGAAQSWQMDNRHKTMIAGDYEHGFAVDLMRKDLSICLREASNNKARLPITALVDQFYAEVQSMGGGRWDTSSLLARLKR